MALTLEIVTPEARVYSDTIESVVLPTAMGEVGILPGHMPLLCQLESGELRVSKGGDTLLLAVGEGFAEVDGDSVRVLAERAINVDDIDEKAAESALRRAQEALAGTRQLSAEESAEFEALVRFASAQLLVKGHKRR